MCHQCFVSVQCAALANPPRTVHTATTTSRTLQNMNHTGFRKEEAKTSQSQEDPSFWTWPFGSVVSWLSEQFVATVSYFTATTDMAPSSQIYCNGTRQG